MKNVPLPVSELSTEPDTTYEFSALELIGILWRGKRTIALYCIAAIALGVVYIVQVAEFRYTAKSVVAIENRQEQLVNFESVVSGLSADILTINTEAEVLKARQLMEKLVNKLDLTADPEFNRHIRSESGFSIAAICESLGFSCASDPGPAPSEQTILDETIDSVIDALRINNVTNSLVFELSITTKDAEKSARIADALADMYIADQLDVKFQATQDATNWMAEKLTELKQDLEDAENAYKDFSVGSDLISAESLEAQNRQLKDFRERADDSEAKIASLDQRINRLLAAEAALTEGKDLADVVAAAQDPEIGSAVSRLGNVTGGRETVEKLLNGRKDRAIADIMREQSQAQTLRSSIADLANNIEAQSADLVELQQLEREIEATRQLYEYFLSRRKETELQGGILESDSRLLSRAVVPIRPSSPRIGMVLALSLVLGFLVGGGLTLRREIWLRSFNSTQEIESATDIVTVGQVPRFPQGRRHKMLSYIKENPNSSLVEAVRNIRTSILMSSIDADPQVIMMTSSVPGEGKTTLSMTMAQSFAGLDKKVLLIEGDIRRRVFREYFKTKKTEGLVSVVSRRAHFEDAVFFSEELGVDVLMGDNSSMNAADFFSSESFREFFDELRTIYDFIIVDTPPVVLVPDARLIGRVADAVIYIVHCGRTPRFQVFEGIRALRSANIRVTGAVLNNIDPKSMRRYVYGVSNYKSYYGST